MDAWEAIKWIPRFLVFAVCLILIMFIFAKAISVNYDADRLKADSAIAMFLYSDALRSASDSAAIALDRFEPESIEAVYPLLDDPTESPDSEEPIVEILTFAPISARFELASLDGSFETREFFYEEETFTRLRQLYVSRDREGIAFARSDNLVRVVDESEPERKMPGRLTIEVII